MSELTSKTLDYISSLLDSKGRGGLNDEDVALLIDYARERAAREACEALLPENVQFTIWRCFHGDVLGWGIEAHWRDTEDEFESHTFCSGLTPTAAYLALYQALKERK